MGKDKKLTRPPEELIVRITNRDPISVQRMTRYLCFRNYKGKTKSVPVRLKRKSTRVLRGKCTSAGLKTLQSLAYTGNRSFWDQMSLENHGGKTQLVIEKLRIQINYDIPDQAADDFWERLRIVDSAISTELAAGTQAIDLEPWARESRCRLAGLDFMAHPAVILAAQDLGKSGSDSKDQFFGNPKYAKPDQALCSEFVSWYYHETGVVINQPNEFRTIDFTGNLRSIFGKAKRLYRYNNATGKFLHSESNAEYLPRSGDFLERRKKGVSEHSMLVVAWDAATRTMMVVNGPWPVTLRRIQLSTIEQTQGKDFWLGRVSPFE